MWQKSLAFEAEQREAARRLPTVKVPVKSYHFFTILTGGMVHAEKADCICLQCCPNTPTGGRARAARLRYAQDNGAS